jgi:multidrug efflux pump subunit AcrA (membrane-fusion protein)
MDIKPNKLARLGTPIVCAILLVLATLSYFIKYPEIISARATLSGTNMPKPIMVYQSGKISHLFTQNGSQLAEGDLIGCMETTADWKEIMRLSSRIDSLYKSLNTSDNKNIEKIMSIPFTNLGELQSDYQTFTLSYIPFRDYVIGAYASSKRMLLENDIQLTAQAKEALEQQSLLFKEDISLSQTTLDNNKALLKDKIISEQEYRELSSRDINKKMTVPQLRSGYVAIASQKNEKQKELLELDNQIKTQNALFRAAAYNFKSKIETWKRNHLLIAPVAGILSFKTFIQENQFLETGKTLGIINPINSDYYLEMLIPQNNLGKVATGQKVLLKFNAWQWQEYGTVTGKIEYISNVASDSGYLAKIILPHGFHTNRGKILSYKEGLQAQAEIITNDITLMQRFYYSMIKQLKND